ncbi:hypothetical protein MKY30_16245 [Oceanobacillus sp. FSL W8-0428]|uniref:hypothetical protein n=1 Tax=Oceanobacillus TaxID=182709 RepID=UPI0030F75C9A
MNKKDKTFLLLNTMMINLLSLFFIMISFTIFAGNYLGLLAGGFVEGIITFFVWLSLLILQCKYTVKLIEKYGTNNV